MLDPGTDSSLGFESRYLAARRRAEALYELSTLITSTLEISPIVELLVTQARQVFGADRAAVFLQSRRGLHCANAVGLSSEYLEAVNRLYTAAVGGQVEQSRRTVYVADAPADPLMGPLRAAAGQEGFRTLVVVPFIQQGMPTGALALYHDTVHVYGDEDLAALNTFANHVAVALANARLFEEAERQVRRSNFLAETGRLLNSSLEMGQVLRALTRAATSVLAEGCAIYLLRKNDDTLALTAYTDEVDEAVTERMAFLDAHPPKLGVLGIGQAVLRGEVLLVDPSHPSPAGADDPFITEFGALSYLAVPLLAQDRLVGALVLWLFNPTLLFSAHDITLAQALAGQAAVALENARLYERELQAQQAKDEFLSAVSHELRTPLTAILGYTQLIRKSLQGEHSRFGQQINIIWSQAQRLHRLVETILDLSNLEQGQLQLNLERLDLWTVVLTALDRLRVATRPGLVFDVPDPPEAYWVMGDRLRLEQVFSHLLTNAVKYSPANGTVRIQMEGAAGRATVCIIDQGAGMSTAQLAQLFARYYQGDTPQTRTGGLGLGLHISRAIVEEHGGTITAASTPGAGAAFCVTLPAEKE